MGIFQVRSLRILSVLPMLIVLLLATSASGQGLFGGLNGLPFFGSFSGGSNCCGQDPCAKGGLEAYIGYMEDPNGTTLTVDRDSTIPGLVSTKQQFTNRGVWLGLAGSAWLGANAAVMASGWYLLPSTSTSRKDYLLSFARQGRSWDVDPQWWFVDGLVVLNARTGPTFLAGLRYDYYDVRFKNPSDAAVIASLDSDTADRTSRAWIPLIGAQYATYSETGNLILRVVGFPTILGSSTFKETIGGASRVEATGNYDSGYFLEVFAEYSKPLGPGTVGIFARWNTLDARATKDSDLATLGGGVANSETRVILRRQAWTFGGSFSLDFYSPL